MLIMILFVFIKKSIGEWLVISMGNDSDNQSVIVYHNIWNWNYLTKETTYNMKDKGPQNKEKFTKDAICKRVLRPAQNTW